MYILIVSDLAKNDKLLNVDRQVKYLDNYYNFSGPLCLFEDGLSYFVTVILLVLQSRTQEFTHVN